MRSSLTMGPRQTMPVCALLCAALFLVANSAPTSSKPSKDVVKTTSQTDLSGERPLTRTKRAEEILYGNHQNAPRVKKSDPGAAASLAAASAEEGQVKAADAAADAAKTDANAIPPEENYSRAEEAEEQLFPVENQDEEQEEGDDQNGFEGGIPMESEETDFPRHEGREQQQETIRRKRNAKSRAALMTAENMVAGGGGGGGGGVAFVANRPIRAKRDLDYEELRELFENSRKAPYGGVEVDDDDFRPVAIVPVLPEADRQNEDEDAEEEEELAEEEEEEEMSKREDVPLAVAIPYSYEPRYDASSEKVELIRELVKQKAEEDAKEKLIDYLLAAAIASSEAESEDDGDGDDGIGGGGGGAGEVADGRQVIEAPVRPDYDDDGGEEDGDGDREAIGPSAAAAAVKRNVFYPYSYEPYGGRWGAMVPGAKRSADEYERLYRLAEALNADNDGENDYEKK